MIGSIVIASDDEDEPEIAVDLFGAKFDAEEVQVLRHDEGNTMLGDFDGNATVNFDDFSIFTDNFGQEDFVEATDLDGSGAVNFDDFFIFADILGIAYAKVEAQPENPTQRANAPVFKKLHKGINIDT